MTSDQPTAFIARNKLEADILRLRAERQACTDDEAYAEKAIELNARLEEWRYA